MWHQWRQVFRIEFGQTNHHEEKQHARFEQHQYCVDVRALFDAPDDNHRQNHHQYHGGDVELQVNPAKIQVGH